MQSKNNEQLNLFKYGKHLFKHRLYNRLAYLKRTGRLIPRPCYVTGRQDVEKHHINYDPERIIYLDKAIHLKLHVYIRKLEDQGTEITESVHLNILDEMKTDYRLRGYLPDTTRINQQRGHFLTRDKVL